MSFVICRELNQRDARYVVVGGFAIRAANYIRGTMDVDPLVAARAENEVRVFAALATLPDHAARELQPVERGKGRAARPTGILLPSDAPGGAGGPGRALGATKQLGIGN